MKVAFLGGGKMAEAMIAALIRSGTARPNELFVSDISEARRTALKSTYGINAYKDSTHLAELAPVIVLAVKPQDLGSALDELVAALDETHLVVSIAAGVTLATLESRMPRARAVRVMPNLACQVGESMSAFTCGASASLEDRRTVTQIMSSCGRVEELPETLFDVVTAVGGSGPAFFAYFVQCFTEVAQRHGMPDETARLFAMQTMLGTARVLIDGDQDPAEFIAAVSSRKGTTAEGMDVLRDSDVRDVIASTVDAAARRSRELSEEG